MKFTCSKDVWARGVGAVQNAVGSPISNPMVENIFLECKGSEALFMATNLNLSIQCRCEVSVEEEGCIALPTKVITGLVRDLPDGDVSFTCKGTSVEIAAASFNGKLMGQPADQFPPFIEVDEGFDVTMDAQKFKKTVRWTIFATTVEKSRFELDGLKWVFEKDNVKVIATDGRRLAFMEQPWVPGGEGTCLIPSKTLHEALSSLPDTGELTLRVGERKAMIRSGDVTMSSNLLVDNFPPYDRIIPKENLISAVISREDLLASVRRSANLANLDTNMITLSLSQGRLSAVGERQEVGGVGIDEIDIDYDGDDLKVYYNYRFLVDVLKVLDVEEITIELWDATRPGVVRPKGEENYLYVIMPMRPPDEKPENSDA